jgi:hypothetical protein
VIYRSTRPDPPLDPPRRLPAFALPGLILGGLAYLLGVLGRRARAARIGLGVLSALIGFAAGLGGLLLIFLWVATNHRAAHANANIMQSVPWAIALVVLGIQVARGRRPAAQRAFMVTAAAAAVSLFGFGARVTNLLPQDNVMFVVLFLPIWLGFAFGFHALLRGETLRTPRPAS